jgi:hypothetical protein
VISPKNLTLAVLAASVLALGAVAYLQYEELVGLRARFADGDATALKRDLANANKTIKSLQDRLSAMRGGRREGEGAGEEGGPQADGNRGGQGWRGGRFGAFNALSQNPQFQKLLSIQAKGRIDQTYGALFKALNLSPEQLAQFQGLLAEKQQALMDVMAAAREQGINPREDPEGFKALVNQAVSQTDQQIQQALGDAGYQQYQQYQQTLPERNTVNSVAQALSYTQTPLTDDQENQLISLLQQNQPQRAGNGTETNSAGGPPGGPGLMALINGGGNARITDDAVAQASGILSAPQVAALQQVQAQQQAQQQIQQMMREANQGRSNGAAPAPAASSGTKG